MIIRNLLRIITVTTLFSFMVSCDLFLPAPVGRNNPEDPDVQIMAFGSAVSGLHSIMTIWDWREASSGISDSRIIDEIWIVHNDENPPTSRFPLNSDEVKKYGSRSSWKAEWTDLSSQKDHFFALYAKEKGGTWLAPRFTSFHLESSPQEQTLTLSSDDDNVTGNANPEEFEVLDVMVLSFASTDVSDANTNYSWDVGNFFILNFNKEYSKYIDSFKLELHNVLPSSIVNIEIYPLKKKFEDVVDWADLIDGGTLDSESLIIRDVQILPDQQIDLTPVVNKMNLYHSGSLAMRIDNLMILNKIENWTIEAHFWGEY